MAAVCAVADQALKLWLVFVFDLGARGVCVARRPFSTWCEVWNPGISYGLFQQEGPVGQWVAVRAQSGRGRGPLDLARAGALAARRAGARPHHRGRHRQCHRPAALAGRDGFCASACHFGGERYEWYVFNLADTVIVAGVIGLMYESLFGDRAAKAP